MKGNTNKAKKIKKPGFIKEFKEFINRGNAFMLAVGVVIGGAFSAIVNAFVNILLSVATWAVPGGLKGLAKKVNKMGMKFGLWFEPESVNPQSDLYKAHPEWALTAPGRAPMMARNQLVLDLSNDEVHEYLYDTISGLLRDYDIDYIKWDFNRPISDVYSHSTPSARQGEVPHRYYLSL